MTSALGGIMGKLLDCIILKQNTCNLGSSIQQHNVRLLCHSIPYNNKGSAVIMLDTSKAFDRVNYAKLFIVLINKAICHLQARLLLFHIRLENYNTNEFRVTNGVKQGGVLSPFLYGIHIDELLQMLNNSKYGCYLWHTLMGSFDYPDDISLLAPTGY